MSLIRTIVAPCNESRDEMALMLMWVPMQGNLVIVMHNKFLETKEKHNRPLNCSTIMYYNFESDNIIGGLHIKGNLVPTNSL